MYAVVLGTFPLESKQFCEELIKCICVCCGLEWGGGREVFLQITLKITIALPVFLFRVIETAVGTETHTQ